MKDLFSRAPSLLALSIFVLLGLGGYVVTQGLPFSGQGGETSRRGAAGAPEKRQLAPDFALERLNGETFRLSDHRGTVVAINFWATWCPPCRKEMPEFIDLQDEMEGEVLFVGISLDKEGPEKVRTFTEAIGVNYPIVIDDGTVTKKYGPIAGIPTTFLVDREGQVRVQAMGRLTKEDLRPVLEALSEGEKLGEMSPPFKPVRRPLGKN